MVTLPKRLYKSLLLLIPDRAALHLEILRRLGYRPDFDTPQRFTEKMQAMKLYLRDTRYGVVCDKVQAKEYVRERLGDDWLIPTYWHGPVLPPEAERNWPVPFVLKANHASGRNYFVRSDAERHWPTIEKAIDGWLEPFEASVLGRERQYEMFPKQLLVEQLIGESGASLIDYKFFVMDGEAKFIQVDTDRFSFHRRSFYDKDWQKQDFGLVYPLDPRDLPRPVSLDEMIRAAEVLAVGFPFLRVDFYEVDGRPRFGEMTLFPESGFGRFYPTETDRVFGSFIPWSPSR